MNKRYCNLPPMSPRPDTWRRSPKRYAEWLWSVLDYLAHEPWESNERACEWLAPYLAIAKIDSNRAPLPPSFALPGMGTDSRGRGVRSKCRQKWWTRRGDHKKWVRDEIYWLKSLLACIGNVMDLCDWQPLLSQMLETYLKTDCGCHPPPPPVLRSLRSNQSETRLPKLELRG